MSAGERRTVMLLGVQRLNDKSRATEGRTRSIKMRLRFRRRHRASMLCASSSSRVTLPWLQVDYQGQQAPACRLRPRATCAPDPLSWTGRAPTLRWLQKLSRQHPAARPPSVSEPLSMVSCVAPYGPSSARQLQLPHQKSSAWSCLCAAGSARRIAGHIKASSPLAPATMFIPAGAGELHLIKSGYPARVYPSFRRESGGISDYARATRSGLAGRSRSMP